VTCYRIYRFSIVRLFPWTLPSALHKVTPITERVSLEFRAEFFNTFNHAQFQAPVGNFAASNFGQVTGANAARIGQGALRVVF
jgi:hypothetical protein